MLSCARADCVCVVSVVCVLCMSSTLTTSAGRSLRLYGGRLIHELQASAAHPVRQAENNYILSGSANNSHHISVLIQANHFKYNQKKKIKK